MKEAIKGEKSALFHLTIKGLKTSNQNFLEQM
jgi:hypothetical protein